MVSHYHCPNHAACASISSSSTAWLSATGFLQSNRCQLCPEFRIHSLQVLKPSRRALKLRDEAFVQKVKLSCMATFQMPKLGESQLFCSLRMHSNWPSWHCAGSFRVVVCIPQPRLQVHIAQNPNCLITVISGLSFINLHQDFVHHVANGMSAWCECFMIRWIPTSHGWKTPVHPAGT